MGITESDRAFIGSHNFDAWVPNSDKSSDGDLHEILYDKLEHFLIHHSGETFTISEMQHETDVSMSVIQRFLKGSQLIESSLERKDGIITRYKSIAPQIEPTQDGEEQMQRDYEKFSDPLSSQAREDFYLMSLRGKAGKKKRISKRGNSRFTL